MNDIKDTSIEIFLNQLASKKATPGGGSVAAVIGAQSAALTSMVCHLTIGKNKYAAVEEDMISLLKQADTLRIRLMDMIQADVDVFDRLMACYGMLKLTEEQEHSRENAIQEALHAATTVPLDCVRACAEAIDLSVIAAQKGNVAAVSDAGVAATAGLSAMKSAALNVYINITSIKDKKFAEDCKTEMELLLQNSETVAANTYQLVKEKLGA